MFQSKKIGKFWKITHAGILKSAFVELKIYRKLNSFKTLDHSFLLKVASDVFGQILKRFLSFVIECSSLKPFTSIITTGKMIKQLQTVDQTAKGV